jgi:hypothetical protein
LKVAAFFMLSIGSGDFSGGVPSGERACATGAPPDVANGSKAGMAMLPRDVRFAADIVTKVENRTTLKSRESRSLTFSAAASLFNATTGVRDRFWMKRFGPLASPLVKRISGSKNFRSSPRKDFCNNIGQKATSRRPPRSYQLKDQ